MVRPQFDVTIIHGSGGKPEGNWFPWLAETLRNRGHEVRVPTFPRPEQQSLQSWMQVFHDEVGELHDDSILIGHSTGCALILNVLDRAPVSISAAFLAAGFVGKIGSEVYDPLNASFFTSPFDWDELQLRAREYFVYAGSDDPYVPLAKGVDLARNLHTELTVIPDGGHLNYQSSFLRFDRLLLDFDRWSAVANKRSKRRVY